MTLNRIVNGQLQSGDREKDSKEKLTPLLPASFVFFSLFRLVTSHA